MGWGAAPRAGGVSPGPCTAPKLTDVLSPAPVLSQNLRWRDSSRFVWTEGLQTLFVFQRLGKGSPSQDPWGGVSCPFRGAPGGKGGCPPSPPPPSRSGRALLLLLQENRGAPGGPPLLPGLALAPQGVCPFPRLMAPLGLWGTHHLSPRLPRSPQCLSVPHGPRWGRGRLSHLSPRDQPWHRCSSCGCWEPVESRRCIPAVRQEGPSWRHNPHWDLSVFVNGKEINWLNFPEAAWCLCALRSPLWLFPAVLAALLTPRCTCSHRIPTSHRVGRSAPRRATGATHPPHLLAPVLARRRDSNRRFRGSVLLNHREGRRERRRPLSRPAPPGARAAAAVPMEMEDGAQE